MMARPDYQSLERYGALCDGAVEAAAAEHIELSDQLPALVERSARWSTASDQVILTSAADIKMAPITWLWPGWLACSKLHLLAGAPGQGKTTIAMALAAAVSAGGRWPDGKRCPQGNVLIWSGEDDPADTLLPRLVVMGACRERIYFVTGARVDGEVKPFDPARDLIGLCERASEVGDVRLMIVDPIVSAVSGDSHKNTEVRRSLQPLVDLAASMGAALVGITHLSKGTAGRDPTERVTGSVAFTAIVRVVMLAAKVRGERGEDRRLLVRTKSNIGPDDGGFEYFLEQGEAAEGILASTVKWGEAVEGDARELLGDGADEKESASPSFTHEVDDALKRILGPHIVPRHEVLTQMKAEGYTEKMVRTARERLGVIVKRSGFGKDTSTYWQLLANDRDAGNEAAALLPAAVVPSDANVKGWAPMGTSGDGVAFEGTNDVDVEVF